ncbi:hypothetical protein L345_12509, partial [Ophiophagus hannah]
MAVLERICSACPELRPQCQGANLTAGQYIKSGSLEMRWGWAGKETAIDFAGRLHVCGGEGGKKEKEGRKERKKQRNQGGKMKEKEKGREEREGGKKKEKGKKPRRKGERKRGREGGREGGTEGDRRGKEKER